MEKPEITVYNLGRPSIFPAFVHTQNIVTTELMAEFR